MPLKDEIIAFSVDRELKASMDEVCHALGMDIATAFTIFARKVVSERRIPFEIVLKADALKPEPKVQPKQKAEAKKSAAESKPKNKAEVLSSLTLKQQKTIEKAEQGDAKSQNVVGTYYETGNGFLKDYDKAIYWYTKAAEQGNTNAQYHLAVIYNKVKNDVMKSYMWFETARLCGLTMNALILDYIRRLEEQLSPSEIKSAQEKAQMKFKRIKNNQ